MALLLSNIETEATKAWNDRRIRFCVVAIFAIMVADSCSAVSAAYIEGNRGDVASDVDIDRKKLAKIGTVSSKYRNSCSRISKRLFHCGRYF
jgi:hypothetical protein